MSAEAYPMNMMWNDPIVKQKQPKWLPQECGSHLY